jgi:hypothetical protein
MGDQGILKQNETANDVRVVILKPFGIARVDGVGFGWND